MKPELQIQKFLRNYQIPDWNDGLKTKFNILAKQSVKYPNLYLFKYGIDSDMSLEICQECRGLILDRDNNWEVVAYPFNKFFNLNEPGAAEIDWDSAKVYEKLDGSLMNLYWYGGKWNWATSGNPDAAGNVGDHGFTFDELVRSTIFDTVGMLSRDVSNDYFSIDLDKNVTYMFELTTPFNQVVVPHSEKTLTSIGARSVLTFEELTKDEILELLANEFKFCKTYDFGSKEEILEALNDKKGTEREGFIVVDKNFNRVKIKSDDYVKLHRFHQGFSQKSLIDAVRTNEGSEILIHFPNLKSMYDELKLKYDALVNRIQTTFDKISTIENQKEFAIAATKHPDIQGFFFNMRAKKLSVKEVLLSCSLEKLQELLNG